MEFQTMSAKLEGGIYSSMEQIAADFQLIFANCREFNPPGTEPHDIWTPAVEGRWKHLWGRRNQLTDDEKKKLITAYKTKLLVHES